MTAKTENLPLPATLGPNLPYRPILRLHRGEGSMAQVFLSKISDNEPDRLVVVKVEIVKPENRDHSQEAIINEVEILSRLNHPGVIKLYPVEESGIKVRQLEYRKTCSLQGYPWFLVLEHLPGGSLLELYNLRSNKLSLSQIVTIFQIVASALAHVHDRGYVHMDLKLQHIYFRRSPTTGDLGDPVLIDFGIARSKERLISELQHQQRVSQYLAPERLLAQRDQKTYSVHPASDMYALGVMLYEMISGQPPYKISDPQTLLDEIGKKAKAQSPYFLTPQGEGREYQGVMLLDRLLFDLLSYAPERRPSASKAANELREIAFWLGEYAPVQHGKAILPVKKPRSLFGHFFRYLLTLLLLALILATGILIGDHRAIRPWRTEVVQRSEPYLNELGRQLEPWMQNQEWWPWQPTATPTFTPTPTAIATPTFTPTPTVTATQTQTFTPTVTRTPLPTATHTVTPIPTATFSVAPTVTGTRTP